MVVGGVKAAGRLGVELGFLAVSGTPLQLGKSRNNGIESG
jgi:hypothetical protein